MIFVTVGTHEQQFNRLVEYMDRWAGEHEEEVIIQTGFSTCKPRYAKWKNLFSYHEMLQNVDAARIVITHGGPSSFIMPLQKGKIPIVCPRKKELDEHVNDHQVDFCKQVSERHKNIIVVDRIETLGNTIDRYESITAGMQKGISSNNKRFCIEFEKIVDKLMR